MKHLLVFLLIVSMIFTPDMIWANDYMDDANKMLEFQKGNTEDFVNRMLSHDVSVVMEGLNQASVALKKYGVSLEDLDRNLDVLRKNFSRISDIKNLNDAELDQLLDDLMKDYGQLNRMLFSMSWAPTTAAIFQEQFVHIVTQMVEGLQYQCKQGRNDVNFNPFAPVAIPPPRLEFSFYIDSSTTGETNVSYDQYNYNTGSKNVENAQKTLSVAGGIGVSVGLSTASYASYAMAAGAAALAVVVIIAVVSYFSGARKRFKLMKEYHKAELHKFYSSLTTEDVSRMYRERCSEISDVLGESAKRIQAISAGGSQREKEIIRYNSEKKMYENIAAELVTLNELQKKIKAKIDKKISDEELEPLRKKETELSEKILKKDLLGMATHNVVGSFGIDTAGMLRKFDMGKVKKVFEERHKALSKIQKLMEMKRSSGWKLLENEMSVFKEYLGLRSEVLYLLSDTFEYIWGKKNKNSVLSKAKGLQSRINSLSIKYLHIEEFRALQSSANWITQFLEREP